MNPLVSRLCELSAAVLQEVIFSVYEILISTPTFNLFFSLVYIFIQKVDISTKKIFRSFDSV